VRTWLSKHLLKIFLRSKIALKDHLITTFKFCIIFRDGIGTFNLYLDVEDEPFVCYGASVFRNEESNTYLYRARCGSWVVGDILGKVKKGAIIRSKDDERESFALVCPCKVCFEVI